MRLPASTVDAIKQLSESGLSASAISSQLGIARSTVQGVVKRSFAAPLTTTAIVANDLPPPQVEEDMSSNLVIDSRVANDFLGSISALNPTQGLDNSPQAEKSRSKQALAFAESLLGNSEKSTDIKKPRSKKEKALIMDAIKELVPTPPPASGATVPSLQAPLVNQPSKADIITQITINVEAFEPLLASIVKPNRDEFLSKLYNKSEKELATLLAVITRTRTVANATNQLRHTTFMVAQGAEMVTSKFIGMRTEGFAQSIMTQDEELKMILKEMVMEQIDSFEKYQRPQMRLALLFTTTLMATDAANRMKDLQKSTAAKVISKVSQDKHKDL